VRCVSLVDRFAVPLLRTVGGSLVIDALAYEAPRLVSVGDTLALSTGSRDYRKGGQFDVLTCVDTAFPSLTAIGRDIDVTCWPSFQGAATPVYDFPVLATLGGGVRLAGQYAFRAPLLRRAAFLRIRPTWDAARVAPSEVHNVELPQLETIDEDLDVAQTNLHALEVPRLRSATGVWVSGVEWGLWLLALPALEHAVISIHGNDMLESVSLPALTSATSVSVVRNPALTSLDAPLLTTLGTLTVTDNPQLPTCQAEAIADRTGAARTISGNGDGTCAP
jgi:hypothetical protein